MKTTAEKLAELHVKLEQIKEPAGEMGVLKRAKKGIPSARDRINTLLDPGTFIERCGFMRAPGDPNALYSDGVVTGHGTINGRPVAVFSHDQTVYGGTVGEMFGRRVADMLEFAYRMGMPFVGINDSGGARIQDAVTSLSWYAELGMRHGFLNGLVPQVSIILGNCAGGAVYAPVCGTEMVVATKSSNMFVTGPDVIKEVLGEDVTLEELGGALRQAEYGNISHVAEDEAEVFAWVRDYLGYLPLTCHETAPVVNPGLEPYITESDLALNSIIPDSDNAAYDMHELLIRLFDDGQFHEVGAQAALNLITGFARIDGKTIGVVANQPMVLAGALDARSSDKAAAFIRLCNAFEIPLLMVVDTPGFMPGLEQEKIGVIRRGSKFIAAYTDCSTPKVTLTVRKAYGGGWAVMGCRQLEADLYFAWPTARIAVIGAEGAISMLGKKKLEEAGENAPALKKQMIDMYNLMIATPWIAAERGYLDAVIEPSTTRLELRKAFKLLENKWKGNRTARKMLIGPT